MARLPPQVGRDTGARRTPGFRTLVEPTNKWGHRAGLADFKEPQHPRRPRDLIHAPRPAVDVGALPARLRLRRHLGDPPEHPVRTGPADKTVSGKTAAVVTAQLAVRRPPPQGSASGLSPLVSSAPAGSSAIRQPTRSSLLRQADFRVSSSSLHVAGCTPREVTPGAGAGAVQRPFRRLRGKDHDGSRTRGSGTHRAGRYCQ